MVENKKKFTEPEIKAVEIEQADIICTSGGGVFSVQHGGNITPGSDSVWGDPLGW